MRDILLVVTLAWLPFTIAVAPEEATRRSERAVLAQWAAALASCANGKGFTIASRVVLCHVADVAR